MFFNTVFTKIIIDICNDFSSNPGRFFDEKTR